MSIKMIYKMYPRKIWILTFVCFIFIARKTIFNVARTAGDYSENVDSSTSLAMLGIVCTTVFFFYHIRDYNVARRKMCSVLIYYLFAWCSLLWAGNYTTISFKAIENI